MGKRVESLKWSKFPNDEIEPWKRWASFDEAVKAAAEDERELRESLAACCASNAALAAKAAELEAKLAAAEADNDALRDASVGIVKTPSVASET